MRYIFILVLSALMFVACSNESDEKSDVSDESNSSTDSEDEEITLENVVSNEENAIDGSDEIKETYEVIKNLEKPGFVVAGDELQHSTFNYAVEEEELTFKEAYYINDVIKTVSYEAAKNYDEHDEDDRYQYVKSNLSDTRDIDNEATDVIAGTHDELDSYYTLATQDNFYYMVHFDRDETTDEMIDLAGKTLKTEEAGAYDVYYDHIGLDLDHIKLPTLNPDKINMVNIGSWYSDYDGFEWALTYKTPDEYSFGYMIMDNDQIIEKEEYKEIETGTLDDGTEVTLYEEEKASSIDVYFWTDDIHYYQLSIDPERSPASEETIYEIIESSLANEVSVNEDGLFEHTNEQPDLGKDEQKIRDLLRELDE